MGLGKCHLVDRVCGCGEVTHNNIYYDVDHQKLEERYVRGL